MSEEQSEEQSEELEIWTFPVIDVATGKIRDGGQYRLVEKGEVIGYLGYHKGARPMIFRSRSPLELEQIQKTLREKLPDQDIGSPMISPCVVADAGISPEKERQAANDFD